METIPLDPGQGDKGNSSCVKSCQDVLAQMLQLFIFVSFVNLI